MSIGATSIGSDVAVNRASEGMRWYAAYTQAKRELYAAAQLRQQNLDVFVPLRLRVTRHARKEESRLLPLFPRYLFVQLSPSQSRQFSVRGIYGVAGLASPGSHPTPAPHDFIEALLDLSDGTGHVRFEELPRDQEPPPAARPLIDHIDVLRHGDEKDTVRLLLDLMTQEAERLS